MSAEMKEHYGPWALIAGASEGIGAAFAHALAKQGLKLVLVARREEPLRALAAELPVETRCIALDLAVAETLAPQVEDLEIGLLVSNAALSVVAPFLEVDLQTLLRIVDVNCRAPLILAHTFGRKMIVRKRGGIICMSSLAGIYGAPYAAAYAATKAFSIVLSESLAGELGPHGIDVSACVAGPTITPTYLASKPSRFPRPMRAEAVVEAALSGLGKRARTIPGLFNKTTSGIVSMLPRRLVLSLVSQQTKRYGKT
jgi:short-subunit dehydrogenase